MLSGEPVLVVDLDAGDAGVEAYDLGPARAALSRLACPSLALCRDAEAAGPHAARLLDRFDVVTAPGDDLEAILDTVSRTPLAALALVQLLRQGDTLDLHERLIAESFVYSMLQCGPEFAQWSVERKTPRPAEPCDEPAVLVLRDGDRLNLTFNRPTKHNAFSAEMRDGLVEGLLVAVADPSVREVVLRGRGRSFCSGGDLDEFGTLPDPVTAHAIRSSRNAARLLSLCGERVRVEVQGACIGAGLELPAFARRIVAAPSAYFQLPELALGLVPGAGGTASIPRRIGRQRTAWMALTGRRVDARTALAWGLVDEIAE